MHMSHSSEFLTIHVASEVSVTPDLIEGDIDGGALMAGHYISGLPASDPINDTIRLPRVASVRPNRPFGINTGDWSKSRPLSYSAVCSVVLQ